jgi:hypothetical protein
MSFHDLHAKAEEIYNALPKCDHCSELLGDETYSSERSDVIDVKFCSEGCAEADNTFCLKETVIASVREQVKDDHRTHGEGEWKCRLYEDGHVVTFKPNVGEKLTWEVHPDTHKIKTEEEINPPGIEDEESPCECGDSGCSVHEGSEECPNPGTVLLRRTDMEDESGSYFCQECAEDAMESGVFSVFYG